MRCTKYENKNAKINEQNKSTFKLVKHPQHKKKHLHVHIKWTDNCVI